MKRITSDESFESFLSDLRDGQKPYVSPALFARKLQIEPNHLAALAHVHPSALNQSPLPSELHRFMRDAIRVFAALTEINGSVSQSVSWFRNQPLELLEDKTAEMLVSDGEIEKVMKYIAMMDAGPLG
jgi:hypothetical protein